MTSEEESAVARDWRGRGDGAISAPELRVLAHPDDALAVFEHEAIWVSGNAMIVHDSLDVPRGTFWIMCGPRILRELAVPVSAIEPDSTTSNSATAEVGDAG
jgi:hypothetical protein